MADNTQQLFKAFPAWLDYFMQDWLRQQPSTRMAYLEGWQPDAHDPTYDYASAFLANVPQTMQQTDVGPAGPRYHWPSTTPGGQSLKAPWHRTANQEAISQMRSLLDNTKQVVASVPSMEDIYKAPVESYVPRSAVRLSDGTIVPTTEPTQDTSQAPQQGIPNTPMLMILKMLGL